MRRRLLTHGALALALILVLIHPGAASASNWIISGNSTTVVGYIGDICRDGVAVAALEIVGAPTYTVVIAAQPGTSPSNGSQALLGQTVVTVPSFPQPTPLFTETQTIADPSSQPFSMTPDKSTYYGLGSISWPELLDPGADVVVYDVGGVESVTGKVSNCFINPTVRQGGTVSIGPAVLSARDSAIPATELKYRVERLPTGGQLRLNGTALQVGATFTQADVNANRLSYAHNGGLKTSDSLRLNLSGITRASRPPAAVSGVPADSYQPAISGNGRFVAFASSATNLVASDTNNAIDIFIRDLAAGTITLASRTASGQPANGGSFNGSIDRTGQTVVFESQASNLAPSACQANIPPLTSQVYAYSRTMPGGTAQMRLISAVDEGQPSCRPGDKASYDPAIAPTGDAVVFASDAIQLVDGDTNGVTDVFIRAGEPGSAPQIPYSGMNNNQPEPANGSSSSPTLSDGIGGTFYQVAFVSSATNLQEPDSNGAIPDIFVCAVDLNNAPCPAPTIVSVASDGQPAHDAAYAPDISQEGTQVAFVSEASNLANNTGSVANVFVHDRDTSKTICASCPLDGSMPNGDSDQPDISAAGRFVTFRSYASNLVAGDTNQRSDIFVYDRDADGNASYDEPNGVRITRVSLDINGEQATQDSYNPSISDDGQQIAFASSAPNLTPDDINDVDDIFVRYMGFSVDIPIYILRGDKIVYLPLIKRMP